MTSYLEFLATNFFLVAKFNYLVVVSYCKHKWICVDGHTVNMPEAKHTVLAF